MLVKTINGSHTKPIGWCYYKVKSEVNELDNYINKVGYNLVYKLKKVGGVAIYDSILLENGDYFVIIKDFRFNLKSIRKTLSQITNSNLSNTSHEYLPIFTSLSSKLIKDINIGLGIEMCKYADGKILLIRKGRNIPLKHQFDSIESGFHKRKDGKTYAICVKGNKRYKLIIVDFYNDDIEEITESSQSQYSELLENYYNVLYSWIYL